jgi:hypothetical protein
LQKQVAELTEKSKEETYIIKGKLFEREKEVQTMQKKHEQDMKDLRKELEPLLVLKKTLEEQGLLKLS